LRAHSAQFLLQLKSRLVIVQELAP
jgi:hypothetical protein